MRLALCRATFSLVYNECNETQIVIRDANNGGKTITNDAEAVVAYLMQNGLTPGIHRMFYYDTEGDRSELLFDARGFKGFVTARNDVTVMKLEPGRRVYCDLCCREFTDSNESGGFFGLGTKAVGPQAVHDGEEQHIKAMCPTGISFADWVRSDLR